MQIDDPRFWRAGAISIIAELAWLARRGGYPGWQSATNIVLGLVLFVMAVIAWAVPVSPLVVFWIQLWIGLIVSSLALWAVLYRLEQRSDVPASTITAAENSSQRH